MMSRCSVFVQAGSYFHRRLMALARCSCWLCTLPTVYRWKGLYKLPDRSATTNGTKFQMAAVEYRSQKCC